LRLGEYGVVERLRAGLFRGFEIEPGAAEDRLIARIGRFDEDRFRRPCALFYQKQLVGLLCRQDRVDKIL